MRGKVLFLNVGDGVPGITPAFAGKRPALSSSWPVPWDHPRMCGEKTPVQVMVEQPKGSPPRLRGKVFVDGEV